MTPLEAFRLIVATVGVLYVTRGGLQTWRDYNTLRGDPIRAAMRVNLVSFVFRSLGISCLWTISLLACLYGTSPPQWVINVSQSLSTAVIVFMVLVARNIRRAQKARS